tara:strand:- start:1690 stop:3540 length:1851 start_codon:yes stop_codon:yes gene_type:complete
MSTYILGISGFYHDAAATIIKDGEIIAAAQEERFSRKKHDPRFPFNAINYCVEEAFIEFDDIDLISFYDNSFLKFNRVVKNLIDEGPRALDVFEAGSKSILGDKIWVKEYFNKLFGSCGKAGKILFCGHHMSHAASAYYPTKFEDAAILTIDGVGEFATTTICKAKQNKIELLKEINFPHSLGLLYSAFTYFCGFKVNSGEYKLMGLAPYGEAKYVKLIEDHLIQVAEDGSFNLNIDYFDYTHSSKMVGKKFERLFGFPSRNSETEIETRYMDVAASIQKVTEKIVLKLARHARKITGSSNLCMAGGVALNCVANGKILDEEIFDNIWIQPAAGDAGGAIGAAQIAYYQYLNNERIITSENKRDMQNGSLLGPSFNSNEIKALLVREKLEYHFFENRNSRNEFISDKIIDGNVIGYFDGRMEFGPRALGARSIIADARNEKMQRKLNLKIKFRESFRPFAPIVLDEDKNRYFDIKGESPYMLFVAPVQPKLRKNINNSLNTDEKYDLLKKINMLRSSIPAVTHVDYSARVQTVDSARNPEMYDLIKAYKNKTGESVLVNTSFNVRGEPIVCTPKDALTCFKRTEMDILVLGDYILVKSELNLKIEDDSWKDEFELD